MAANFDVYKLWSLCSLGIAIAMLHDDGRLALCIGSLVTYFVFNLLSGILGDDSFQSYARLRHNYMEKFKVKERGMYVYNTFAGDCIEAAASMILSKIVTQTYLHHESGKDWSKFAFNWADLKVGLMVVCLFVVPVYNLFFNYILPNCPRFLQHREARLVQLIIFNPLFNFILSIFANWCLNMYYNPANVNGIKFALWSPVTNSEINLAQAFKDSIYLWWNKPINISKLPPMIFFGAEKYINKFMCGQFISFAFWIPVWTFVPPIYIYFFVGFVWNIIFDLVILGLK